MAFIITLYTRFSGQIEALLGNWFLPTLARFSFAAVLYHYFFNAAKTKLGHGIFGFLHPSDTAYIQIFPKTYEAVGYDSSALGSFHWLVAVIATNTELVLPFLLVIGLFTRLTAIGMAGFVLMQSYVDVTGHDLGGEDIGAWFDGTSNSLLMDQRLLWMVLFAIMIAKGGGPFSIDAVLKRIMHPW